MRKYLVGIAALLGLALAYPVVAGASVNDPQVQFGAKTVTLAVPPSPCRQLEDVVACTWQLSVNEPDTPGAPLVKQVEGTSGVLSVDLPAFCGVIQADALVGPTGNPKHPWHFVSGHQETLNTCPTTTTTTTSPPPPPSTTTTVPGVPPSTVPPTGTSSPPPPPSSGPPSGSAGTPPPAASSGSPVTAAPQVAPQTPAAPASSPGTPNGQLAMTGVGRDSIRNLALIGSGLILAGLLASKRSFRRNRA